MSLRSRSACRVGRGWLLAILAFTHPALPADARELYRLGLELYDERQYEGALEKFAASFQIQASPSSKLYVARCLRSVGRTSEAIVAYEQTAQLAKDRTSVEPKYEQTYQNALRELAVLKPPPLPEQRYVAATWTAGGVGVVGLASFGVFGAMARSHYESLESHCDPLPCPASQTGTVATGRNFQLLANVSLAVGISGAITAVTLYVLGRPKALPYAQVGFVGTTLQLSGEF